MAPNRYKNFDLMINRAPQGYRAHVIASPAGEAAAIFQLPASIANRHDRLAFVGGAIRAYDVGGEAGADAPAPLDPKLFGRELYAAVFGGDVGVSLRRSLDFAQQDGAGLRIRLRLTDAPELAVLPWEYLYSTAEDRYLALSDQTPLLRYMEIGQGAAPLAIQLPLRVLVMVSDPVDVAPRLNVEAEYARLKQALADLGQDNALVLERAPATLADLQRRLRRNEYHVFHFIGHGWYDEGESAAGLLMEDAQHHGQQADADKLGILLRDHRTLRLAFLNACEGARADSGEPFAGVAQHLVQQELPAVIAMQFPVTDQAAISLAQEFYQALADGLPVDAALTEARKALFLQGSEIEWGTPALFSRADDNRLFTLGDEAAAESISPAVRPASSSVVNTGGGAYIGGGVNTRGGDFVGRDKITGAPPQTDDREQGASKPPEPRPQAVDRDQIASWRSQLQNYRTNLRMVEERIAEYVVSTDVPLGFLREKEKLLVRIADLEEKLSGGDS